MATEYISKRIAEGVLLDYFPSPTPSEFKSEIIRAYSLIGLEVSSLTPAEVVCIESEIEEAGGSASSTATSELQVDYVFSVYYLLLVQQFAMTLAHDSSMKDAVSSAMHQLALQPDQVLALGRGAARLHSK